MRYSDNFMRDVRFYLQNRHKFIFFGGIVASPQFARAGISGVEAFRLFDSTGCRVPTKHPRLFIALMRTKKSVNWHIKEWADGFHDMFESITYYVRQFVDPPSWIEGAIRGAIAQATNKRHKRIEKRG